LREDTNGLCRNKKKNKQKKKRKLVASYEKILTIPNLLFTTKKKSNIKVRTKVCASKHLFLLQNLVLQKVVSNYKK